MIISYELYKIGLTDLAFDRERRVIFIPFAAAATCWSIKRFRPSYFGTSNLS